MNLQRTSCLAVFCQTAFIWSFSVPFSSLEKLKLLSLISSFQFCICWPTYRSLDRRTERPKSFANSSAVKEPFSDTYRRGKWRDTEIRWETRQNLYLICKKFIYTFIRNIRLVNQLKSMTVQCWNNLHCPVLRLSFPPHCEIAAEPPLHHCQILATYKKTPQDRLGKEWQEKRERKKRARRRDPINTFMLKQYFITNINQFGAARTGLVRKQACVSFETPGNYSNTGLDTTSNNRKLDRKSLACVKHAPTLTYILLHKRLQACAETTHNLNSPQRELQRLKHLARV